MYLVGDRVTIPNPLGGEINGTIAVIDEQINGNIAYIIETDDNQAIVRFSEDDQETSFVDNISLAFS